MPTVYIFIKKKKLYAAQYGKLVFVNGVNKGMGLILNEHMDTLKVYRITWASP